MDNRIMLPQPMIPGVKTGASTPASKPGQTPKTDFQDMLNKAAQEIKFSQHALQRLNKREIPFGETQMAKLADAVDKAAKKGAKESLILMQDMAFVVSVKNRTVITAVDGGSLKDNVFTQIDSAVIVPE